MYHFAALVALGLCADPQDTNKPAAPADLAKVESDVKAVLDRLSGLEKSLKSFDEQHSKLIALLGENVQNQINDIHKKLNALRADLDDWKRTHTSSSEKRNDAAAPMAAVMLVNARPDMVMEAMVNGARHWVEPNQNRVIPTPAGIVRVQVVGVDAVVRDRAVVAGATHVVTLK